MLEGQGNGIIRGGLSAMLVTAGYDRGMVTISLGLGCKFKGSTRSGPGLKVAKVTNMIVKEFEVEVAPQTKENNPKKCSGGLKRKFGSA